MEVAPTPEAWVGNVHRDAKAEQLGRLFQGYGIDVLGRALKIQTSNRARNLVFSDPDRVVVVPNCGFSVGHLTTEGVFYRRWSSRDGLAHVKATFDFQKGYMHLCFRKGYHEYMIRYHLNHSNGFCDHPHGLVLAFNNTPQVFRQDIEIGSDVSRDLWMLGDVEEERKWRRTIDYITDEDVLSECSMYCVQLPNAEDASRVSDGLTGMDLPRIVDDCPGPSMRDLVPRVSSSQRRALESETPYDILFQVECLASNGAICKPLLDWTFYWLLQTDPQNKVRRALQYLNIAKDQLDDPAAGLKETLERNDADLPPLPKAYSDSENLVMVNRVYITPLTIWFWGPEPETANRVLRQYRRFIDRFLRVNFTDEHFEKLPVGVPEMPLVEIRDRIRRVLSNGFHVGGRKFEFLAMSSSQLRENSRCFFAPTSDVTCESIRAWMGSFDGIKNAAKYVARMGQCFSSTATSPKLRVDTSELREIEDVKTADGQYTFSDGIGKLSQRIAREAAESIGVKTIPSAFQIRFAGYKGVATVQDIGARDKLHLRPSMRKFPCQHRYLEIVRAATNLPGFLNRQLITLLSTLGIPDTVFIRLQKRAIQRLDRMLQNSKMALEQLQEERQTDSRQPLALLIDMLRSGFDVQEEPFLQNCLLSYRAQHLRDLESKTRIPVPKAACLMGLLDEQRCLSYGEVFVRLRDPHSGEITQVTGPVAVGKNPCFHPGDIRVLQAVDTPKLRGMVDCLVFPQKGPRPHTDECSESDLDGDIYFVTWDRELIPLESERPMDYTPPIVKEEGPVTMADVHKFFVNYMQNDVLGQIANSHLAIADASDRSARDVKCIKLARLHSVAVDFPKTGAPAKLDRELRPASYPDFMAKPDKVSYESQKVIGKMYRMVRSHRPHGVERAIDYPDEIFDPDLEVTGHEDYIQEARVLKRQYEIEIRGVMKKYRMRKESDAIAGYVPKLWKFYRRRQRYDVQIQVRHEVRQIRRRFYRILRNGPDDLTTLHAKASAWYMITYHPQYFFAQKRRNRLISFPWVAHDIPCSIKRSAKNASRATS